MGQILPVVNLEMIACHVSKFLESSVLYARKKWMKYRQEACKERPVGSFLRRFVEKSAPQATCKLFAKSLHRFVEDCWRIWKLSCSFPC